MIRANPWVFPSTMNSGRLGSSGFFFLRVSALKQILGRLQTFRRASTAFSPPKAKEFEIAERMVIGRATFGT